MADTAHLLIAEDDLPLSRLLHSCLSTENFTADLAHDGEHALELLLNPPAARDYDLLLLDLSLPKKDGLTLLAELEQLRPELPVLVLTGRSGTAELVRTLNSGADDYLTKPFSVEELLARVRALLRRRPALSPVPATPGKQGLSLDRESHRVHRGTREIELTRREFDLLEYLMQQAPKPVSRSTLMEEVWRVPFDPKTNIVDVYMKYLRDKIDTGSEPKLIRTVRGIGYAVVVS